LRANEQLIEDSLLQLVKVVDEHGWKTVNLPRLGCGAGELDWATQIRPMMEEYLNNRFHCYTFNRQEL
jgi:O-acetyl-ADP-ribose deacetylase (regulator of RNase III)